MALDQMTRPIIGIENRTAQEVFDIMCDRFKVAALGDGWQPIETAPKDGTHVLLIGDKDAPKTQAIGWQNNDIVTPGCFNTAWGNWWPTHWCPLPTPPGEKK